MSNPTSDADMLASIFGDPAGGDPHPEMEATETEVPESEDEGTEGTETETPEAIEGSHETEEPAEEQPAQNPEEARLFAGKYKTVEELERAYQEAQKDFHAGRQEQGAIKREIDELRMMLVSTRQPEPQQPTREQIEAKREELRRRLQYEPEAVIDEMAEQKAIRIVEDRLNQVLGPVMPSIQRQAHSDQLGQQVQQYWRQYPEREEYKDAMADIISNNPDIMKQPDWINQAYLRAKIASLEAKINTPAAPPTKKVSTGQKKAAAVAVSTGAKGAAPEKKTDDEMVREHIFGASAGKRLVFDD